MRDNCVLYGQRLLCVKTVAVVVASLVMAAPASWGASRLLPREQLAQLGLTRAWFAQVRLDPARNRLERAVLHGDRLTVLTSAGVVEEFNALTGEALWIAPVGNENYPSLGPACSDKHIALVNGSTLYVLDRKDGRPVSIRRVGGAPGAAPAISEKYVFVPLTSGRIEGYSLENLKKLTPWYYQSNGRTMVAPLATPQSVVWTTDTGVLYVGSSETPVMRFMLETGAEIVAPPAYRKPSVYVASTAGEVFAMEEMTGLREWKFATGFPVTRAPAAVGERVFVTSEEPALHCIDAKSGGAIWQVPHMSQFASASKQRVYGVDDLGAFVALDGAKGAMVGKIGADHAIQSMVNDQTDRIYLITRSGVIECLRETDAKEPLYHNPQEAEGEKPEAGAKPAAKPGAVPPKPAVAPPAAAENAEEKGTEPAAAPPAGPAEKPATPPATSDDNPFGG